MEQGEIKEKRTMIKVRWEKAKFVGRPRNVEKKPRKIQQGIENTVCRNARPSKDGNEQLGAHLQKTATGHVQVV